MSGPVIARLDRFARQQKRAWFGRVRRGLKIAGHGAGKAIAAARLATSKRRAHAARRGGRLVALYGPRVRKPFKILRERLVNAVLAARNLSRKAVLRLWGWRRPFVRWRRNRRRTEEKWAALRVELALEREIDALADGTDPIIVGPWLSEVGFETLYWIPFVRWFRSAHHIKSDRLCVLTRGGAAAWYADITPHHVEIFDLVTPEAFATYNNAKAEATGGTVKQLGMSAFERDLVDQACGRWGVPRARVLHPSLMYRLFQQFWAGNRPLSFLDEHTLYTTVAPPAADRALPPLPDDYVAVKFYAAQSLQDTPDTRRLLGELLAAISETHPIVLLDTGLALDDHGDYGFQTTKRVVSAREWMTPRDNLAVQTRIIAGARAFVGTCGGIAWLAPMLGIDTTAVMTDVRFLNVHLHVARRVYRVLDRGRFTPFDLGALAPLGLGLAASARSTEPA